LAARLTMNRSVDFFETQFQAQTRAADFALNPFETLAFPYVSGRTLDLGCGLGNLAIEAAKRGSTVVALDASPTAIAHLRQTAASARLPIQAELADLTRYRITAAYETIVAIGLLMFFAKERARELLEDIKAHVRPGGHAIINTLIDGTTYADMFVPDHYYLFTESELRVRFEGWTLREFKLQRFAAPRSTVKAFATIVARRTDEASAA
jgi:tellurite methyltransferase